MPEIFALSPVVQHYQWGGYRYIPALLGIENQEHLPYAELWMGAHPRGAARIRYRDRAVSLPDWLAEAPLERLGPAAVDAFGPHLPFLFKVLDVRQMLSIQAHPDKRQAEAGFRRENEEGIPLDAPHRNFKDPNHKPEVMAALSDFWLLHGFRPPDDIRRTLEPIPELRPLLSLFAGDDLRALYAHLMRLPQSQVDEILHPLRARLYAHAPADRSHPDFWAARAFRQFDSAEGHSDRGIFSIYLFNLVHLQPGQGIYQAAGIPHAYLEGVNVELMANSDNVFRGGLTAKHIDIDQLMSHLLFTPVVPEVIAGARTSDLEYRYPTPAPDFELSHIDLTAGAPYTHGPARGPEILINLEGEIRVNGRESLGRGTCLFVPHGARYQLSAPQRARLFKAALPGNRIYPEH